MTEHHRAAAPTEDEITAAIAAWEPSTASVAVDHAPTREAMSRALSSLITSRQAAERARSPLRRASGPASWETGAPGCAALSSEAAAPSDSPTPGPDLSNVSDAKLASLAKQARFVAAAEAEQRRRGPVVVHGVLGTSAEDIPPRRWGEVNLPFTGGDRVSLAVEPEPLGAFLEARDLSVDRHPRGGGVVACRLHLASREAVDVVGAAMAAGTGAAITLGALRAMFAVRTVRASLAEASKLPAPDVPFTGGASSSIGLAPPLREVSFPAALDVPAEVAPITPSDADIQRSRDLAEAVELAGIKREGELARERIAERAERLREGEGS
jgi:hypothetical protein